MRKVSQDARGGKVYVDGETEGKLAVGNHWKVQDRLIKIRCVTAVTNSQRRRVPSNPAACPTMSTKSN